MPPIVRPVIGLCNLEIISNSGEISFGNDYQNTSNIFKVNVDDQKKRIKIKLDDINVNGTEVRRGYQVIRFQVDVPDRYEGNSNYWRRGVEVSIDELNRQREIEIQTRVAVPKMQLKAGEYEIRTNWTIEC